MSNQGTGGEQGGRYNRSANGLVGALLLTVLSVGGFVVFRNIFSDDLDQGPPQAVEYLDAVQGLQANEFTPVYPPTTPDGWIVTRVGFEPGDRPRFELNLYTDDQNFVGIRQADQDVDDLLDEAGVDDAAETDPLTGVGPLADTWDGWSDPDGDHAFSTVIGDQSVVVYGAVSADELAGLVALLSTDVVAPAP